MTTRDLRRDTRGAAIVIGLFFAVMLSGFLYYVIGIGEAIVYRETMQDAADAGAFSAAVVHARGMNVIVLINLIMAALLAVLIALKLIQTLILTAMAVAFALAFVTFGATLAAIPPLNTAQRAVGQVHDRARTVVFRLLRVGRTTARLVQRAMPPAATYRAYDIATDDAFAPAPRFGFTWPIGIGRRLPTEDGSYPELCRRAAGEVSGVVAMPFNAIHSRIGSIVRSAMTRMITTFTRWFCSGDGAPPSFEETIQVALPELQTASATECRNCPAGDDCTAACDTAQREQVSSQPPEGATSPFDCPKRADGTDEPLCAQRAAQARIECGPSHRDRFDFVFQRASMRRRFWRERVGTSDPPEYRDRHTGDALSDPSDPDQQDQTVRSRRGESRFNPCSSWPMSAPNGWSTEDNTHLCGGDRPSMPDGYLPGTPLPIGLENAATAEWDEVPRLFACHTERNTRIGDPNATRDTPSDTSQMVPQRMLEGAQLGEETFQIRMIVVGHPPDGSAERGVELANWGRDVASGDATHVEIARRLGEISVAQAEFYYPSTDLRDREDWMWNMRWRARMRRFRMPGGQTVGAECSQMAGGSGGSCGGISGVVGMLQELVVH
jgi:hypothetical protein